MAMMQCVAITGVEEAEIREILVPTAKDNFVVVKIRAIPLCTEFKAYFAGSRP